MNPQYLLVIAVMIVMGWFVAGILVNLRRGDRLLRWLRGGLPRIGERTTFRWLGTSVVELVIAQAKRPFRRLETLIVLAPRDVAWMWVVARLQGRRDTLIFRANLTAGPLLDLELVDPSIWTGRTALKEAAQRGWVSQPYRGVQLLAPPGRLDQAAITIDRLSSTAERLAPHFYRFCLRKEHPHLELHMAFPDTRTEAGDFFTAFQDLARAVAEKPGEANPPDEEL